MTDYKKGATPLGVDKDGKTKIYLCSTEQVDKYPNGVDALLELLGVKAALVTDASSIGDFTSEQEVIDRIAIAADITVERRTLVWTLAQIFEGQMK